MKRSLLGLLCVTVVSFTVNYFIPEVDAAEPFVISSPAFKDGTMMPKKFANNTAGNANCVGSGCAFGGRATMPVARFAPNAFGLYDTHGNVFEWVEDCWNENFSGAPANGSAWLTGDCKIRVQRGGAWGYPRGYLRIAVRGRQGQAYRYINAGVRVAREMGR